MSQNAFGGRASPGPAGELKRSPRPLSRNEGLLLRGRGWEGREEKEGIEGKEGEGREWRKGKGGEEKVKEGMGGKEGLSLVRKNSCYGPVFKNECNAKM